MDRQRDHCLVACRGQRAIALKAQHRVISTRPRRNHGTWVKRNHGEDYKGSSFFEFLPTNWYPLQSAEDTSIY